MTVSSLEFLIPLLALAAIFNYLPTPFWKQVVLAICNGLFVYLCVPDAGSWIMLGVFVLSGFCTAKYLTKIPGTRLLGIYLTLLVVAFMILKQYVLVSLLVPAWLVNHPLTTIGLSYMLFRQIHFLVDVSEGQIGEFSLWSYLNYQFNLFGFISGPIQRYQDFSDQWKLMPPLLTTRHQILTAYLRIFIGVLKVSFISSYLLGIFETQRSWFLLPSPVVALSHAKVLSKFIVYFYTYLLYLYFNFSGYCDIVIAGGALLCVKLPENFDRPYLSRNLIDYWTRFHRSLGFWIRDYLFTPMYRAAATRWSDRASVVVFPCYLAAFLIAGIWHGSTMNFVIFGLLHGIGATMCKLWEYYIIKRRGRKGFKAYLASTPIQIVAIAITLNFVAFTTLFFPGDVRSTMTTFRSFIHHMTSPA